MKVLVLGGTGFIGRHAARAALQRGHEVIIGTRSPERAQQKLPDLAATCVFRTIHVERLLKPDDWMHPIADVDSVINCVGILRQRWAETYDRVHHLAPAALACACAQRHVRLVHVSALGLHADAKSRFLRSKLRGELAIRNSGADWSLVRPSLLDGEGGYGARWLRRVARWPIHPVPVSARGRLAILQVTDLGQALTTLSEMDGSEAGREIEVGGNELRTMHEHLTALRTETHTTPAWHFPVPHWFARLASHLCDLLHVTPFSFGHLELLSRDNVPRSKNALAIMLVRTDALTSIATRAD